MSDTQPPQPPQPPYGAPQYRMFAPKLPDHPQGIVILVLGILGIVACQVLGPVAWVMGSRARQDIKAAPGRYGNEGMVTGGWVCGIIATGFLVVYGLILIVFLIALASGAMTSSP